MLKVMAVLRTLFLVGIVAYLLWVMPLGVIFSGATTREAASFKVGIIEGVASAAWVAIGWITLETALGWVRVWLAGRKAAKAATSPAPAEPAR
jgi:hypothetical protein